MIIEGTYTLQATPEDVWLSLMDNYLIEKAVPGLQQLERLEEPNFSIAMHVQQAPLSGVYQGRVTVTQKFPSSYNLSFEGEGQHNAVNGTIVLNLDEDGDNTVVTYKCILNLDKAGKPLASTMVKGNIKHFFQQFFAALADYHHTRNSYFQEMEMSQDIELSSSLPQHTLPPFLPSSPARQPAFLYALVRFLRLGNGDSEQEEQWVNRLRRASMVSGLLLLVWVGTRIPRRRGAKS